MTADQPAGAAADARDRARVAWALVGADPRRARDLAAALLAETDDPSARVTAHRTAAFAALELETADGSVRHGRAAVREARRTDDALLLAEAEMVLAAAYQYAGARAAALRLARQARERAPDNARLALQHGVFLERLGAPDEALVAYDAAEFLATRDGDDETLVRVRCNRGVLRTYRAELDGAQADLAAAAEIATQLDLGLLGAGIEANLGFLAARRGALVDALQRLDAVDASMEAAGGMRHGIHQLDRCEVLLLAGLARDAVAAGRAAVRAFDEAGLKVELAEARVVTAQAALVAGDVGLAEDEASRALRSLARLGAGPWAALAREAIVRAQWLAGRRDVQLERRAERAAADLQRAGWHAASARARIVAARLALERGRPQLAEQRLAKIDDRRTTNVAVRVQVRCARARLRMSAGDSGAAKAALGAAWAILERHRATLGATELRAGVAAFLDELTDLGIELTMAGGEAVEVFRWAERGRAGALAQPRTQPPDDAVLAEHLARLRIVTGEIDAARKAGDQPRQLLRQQAELERRVRDRARLVPAGDGDTVPAVLDERALSAALRERSLVEYVASGGVLHAVVLAGGVWTSHELASVADVSVEVDGLLMALRRLAFGSPVPQLRFAARAAVDRSTSGLRSMLIAPLADRIGDAPHVVVPTGALHSLPWSALVALDKRLVVAPSAGLWQRAQRPDAPAAGGPALLVAGPRLAEADAEVAQIAGLRPGSRALVGEGATVDEVREAMAGASLAHLACHGHFRADNPLFSSLELHDGALSVFELERMGRAPEQIILSACDAGLSAVHPGDELLGLAAALLRLGTTGIVASVLPVPDGSTRRLMVGLHEALAAGEPLAAALASARSRLDPERDDDLVAAAAFQVLGAG